jgi:glycerate kinase
MRVVVAPDKFKGSLTAVEAPRSSVKGCGRVSRGSTSSWLRSPTAVTAPSTAP